MPFSQAPSAAEKLPKSIGNYEPLAVFARRAFSKTYRAKQPELLRTVLLKTLHPSVSARSPFGQLLEREAKVLGPLEHDCLLKLLTIVRGSDAIALIFEDSGGHTLSDLMAEMRRQNRRLEMPICLAIAHSIARGLAYLHERGVVHCDLMPDNLLITPEGMLKIFEFSAARDENNWPIPELLEGEGIFSKPDYWAPERRLDQKLGPRADVFSLGVMLYEMLSFELPFSDPGLQGGQDKKSEAEERPHKSRGAIRPLRALLPELPRAVNDVVMRCLAKRPLERFENGKALLEALGELLAEFSPGAARRDQALCARAMYLARFIDAEPVLEEGEPAGEEHAAQPEGAGQRQWFQFSLQRFALIFMLIVIGGIFIELVLKRGRGDDAPLLSLAGVEEPGYVRVLARPWAEVYIDGEHIDTTPIGKPIAVAPGRRHLTLKHPNAPEEKRTIVVLKSQTVIVDVSMRIDRAVPDAGRIPTNIDSTP